MERDWTTRGLLFLLVWASIAWFGSWELNPNNAVRMFAAISMVEDGDATIDEFASLTIDKATFGPHTYLDKAPGMTLTAVPAVALVDAVTGARAASVSKAGENPRLVMFLRYRQWTAVMLWPAVLTALAAVLLYEIGLGLTGQAEAALFGAVGYALGTPIWGWSATVLGHAPVAALYLVAVWSFLAPARAWRGALGGAALGWAVVVEYQAALAGSVIAAWAAMRWIGDPAGRRALAATAVAGAVSLLPIPLYNQFAFGTPFRVAYSGVRGFDGMHQGLFGLTWPRPRVLGELLVGDRRGLFWVTPVLFVAPVGLAAMIDDRRTRGLAAMAATAALVVLLVNASYHYWDGGNSAGPRHSMPALGLLAIGFAPCWAGIRSAAGRWTLGVLLLLSIAINAVIASADVFAAANVRMPIWNYVVADRFLPGYLQTWTGTWLGWTPWPGFLAWIAVAATLSLVLVRRVSRDCA